MDKGLNNEEIREFVKISKQLQPNVTTSSRIGDETATNMLDKDMLFDFYNINDNYFTGDQLPMHWEMAGTRNGSWGYRKNDNEWRTPIMILNSHVARVSRNGNYLLNIGPGADGSFPPEPVNNLKIAGSWLKKYGESIYGAKSSPFPWNYNWGYVTQKPNKLCLNIADLPKNNQIELNCLITKIDDIEDLGTSKILKFDQKDRFLTIDLSSIEKRDLLKNNRRQL